MANDFRLSPVYDVLLRGREELPVGLYHLQLATAEQLTRLHYSPGSIKTVKARLKTLADNNYIVADSIPTKMLRKPYYYMLGLKGFQYLTSAGLDVPDARVSRDNSYLFIDHSLELSDILIATLRLRQANPRFYLARYRHERDFKRAPYKTTVAGQPFSLIPDAFLDIRMIRHGAADLAMPLLIEHDRGTEEQGHFRRRIRAYKAFLHAEAYKTMLRTNSITVCFTTFKGGGRIAKMREWTKAEIGNDQLLQAMFLFGDMVQPLEPRTLLFERRWLALTSDQPLALLEE